MRVLNRIIRRAREWLHEAELLGPKRSFIAAKKTLIQKIHGLPKMITVEASSRCNLNCAFCVTNELEVWTHREKTFLSFAEFKKLIDETRRFCSQLNFSLYGEPLLNPDLFGMIAYANQQEICTTLFTNATLLTNENIDKLLRSGLTRIIASFESFDKDLYEKTKCGARLDLTQSGIERLIAEKKRRNMKAPQIVARVVVTKKTIGDIDSFLKKADKMGVDAVSLKPLTVWPQGNEEYKQMMFREFVIDHPISRYSQGSNGDFVFHRRRVPCLSIDSPAVLSDGRVCLCWYDFLGESVVGNINHDDFISIWRKSRSFRKEMNDGNAFSFCSECPGTGAKRHKTITYQA